ncbi:hypothetical protein WA158_000913 [Blastocystis sp. Blastoise]
MINILKTFFISAIVFLTFVSSVESATVEVFKGPVSFYFVDCTNGCNEIVGTRQESKETGSTFAIDLPTKPKINFVVICQSSDICQVRYNTNAWSQSVSVNSKEINTYPASNTKEGLVASYSPSTYNSETIHVTLMFKSTLGPNVNTQLSENSFVVKDGSITEGSIQKINDSTYSFEIKPNTPQSNVAILLNRELLSEEGLPLAKGLIHTIIYDATSPKLLNAKDFSYLPVDKHEKTYQLHFDKDIDHYVILNRKNIQSIQINTISERVFEVQAIMQEQASFATLTPTSALTLVHSIPANENGAKVPRNPRIELVFNMDITIVPHQTIILENGEKVYTISTDDKLRVAVSSEHKNILYIYVNSLSAVHSTLMLPANTLVSTIVQSPNASLSLEFDVSNVLCGTSYVTGGMKEGDKCQCFDIGQKCECICGETYFLRAL